MASTKWGWLLCHWPPAQFFHVFDSFCMMLISAIELPRGSSMYSMFSRLQTVAVTSKNKTMPSGRECITYQIIERSLCLKYFPIYQHIIVRLGETSLDQCICPVGWEYSGQYRYIATNLASSVVIFKEDCSERSPVHLRQWEPHRILSLEYFHIDIWHRNWSGIHTSCSQCRSCLYEISSRELSMNGFL